MTGAKATPVKRKAVNGFRFLLGGYRRFVPRTLIVGLTLAVVTMLHLSIPWMVGEITSYLELVQLGESQAAMQTPAAQAKWHAQYIANQADPHHRNSWLVQHCIDWAHSTPQPGHADLHVVYFLLGTLALFLLVRAMMTFAHIYSRVNLTQRCLNVFRQMVFNKVTRLGFGELGRIPTGEIISRGLRDVMKAQSFVSDIFWNVEETFLYLIMAVGVIWSADWRLMLAGLTCLPIASVMMYVSTRQMKMRWKAAGKKYDRISDTLHDSIVGVRVVKSFGTEDAQKDRFSTAVNRFAHKVVEAGEFLSAKIPWNEVWFNLTTPITLAVGVFLYAAHDIGVAQIVMSVLMMRNIAMRLKNLGNQLNPMQEAVASAERIQDFLDVPEKIVSVEHPTAFPTAGGDLVFEHVNYRHIGEGIVEREELDKYIDEEEEAEKKRKEERRGRQSKELSARQHPDRNLLEDINLVVPQGSTLGICGPTGCGKSTLVSLMLRLYDPGAGAIKVGGTDLRKFDVVELRRRITMVFQETFLFSATVADNIAMGRPAASDAEIREAAARAQADGFIQKLSDGYDTVIGERGVDLSGGQKQRLALARAICMQPNILILDDSSAALDPETESLVREALESMDGTMTRIVISSRLSTLRRTQRIVVLDKGRVVGLGSHAELLASCELYGRLFEAQMADAEPQAPRKGGESAGLPAVQVDLGGLKARVLR